MLGAEWLFGYVFGQMQAQRQHATAPVEEQPERMSADDEAASAQYAALWRDNPEIAARLAMLSRSRHGIVLPEAQ